MADEKQIIEGESQYGTKYVANKLGMTANAIQKWAMIVEQETADKNYFKHGKTSRSFSLKDIANFKKVKELKSIQGVSVTNAVTEVFIESKKQNDTKNGTIRIPKNGQKNNDLWNVIFKDNVARQKELEKLVLANKKLQDKLDAQEQQLKEQSDKLDRLLELTDNKDFLKQANRSKSFWNRLFGR